MTPPREGILHLMGSKSRRRYARTSIWVVAVLTTGIFSLSGISLYRVPTPEPTTAWIAVLQPGPSLFEEHQVRLVVQPRISTPSLRGERGTYTKYSFSVCGEGPLDLLAIWGGGAAMTDARSDGQASALQNSERMAAKWALGTAGAPTEAELHDVQWIRIEVSDPPSCLVPPGGDGWIGAGASVDGYTTYPWTSGATGFGVLEPHRWIVSAPVLGTFDEDRAIREVELAGIDGAWARPPRLKVEFYGADLPLHVSAESARPALSDGSTASWAATNPIRPIAMIRNHAQVEFLQLIFTVSGVVAGVFWGIALQARARAHPRREDVRTSAPHTPTARDGGFLGSALGLCVLAALYIADRLRRR